MFEIEQIICIKMDLALNNLQRLICHKTQTTNQPTSELKMIRELHDYFGAGNKLNDFMKIHAKVKFDTNSSEEIKKTKKKMR